MQGRMMQHQLNNDQIESMLLSEQVGRLATLNANGFPYVVPAHFVYSENKIYIHGCGKGQKIDNIKLNSKVCFEIDHMSELILSENPCNVNTAYESVVIIGSALILNNSTDKATVLKKIVDKYTPALSEKELPARMINATSVIEITILECTGKYYR